MADFVVNVTLIVALFVLLVVWAVSASRRRRRDRREHAQERRLILGAFTAAAEGVPLRQEDLDDTRDSQPPRTTKTAAGQSGTIPAQHLDPASIVALLDLLEDRKPPRRGMIASLFTSPGSVWSAGMRAGQSLARNTTGNERCRHDDVDDGTGSQLYREAARELVEIYAHDPSDARAEYLNYAAAVGDLAMAELHIRAAAYATYAGHDEVAQLIDDITQGAPTSELRGA
jgi:transcriptional regulator of met regulon